MYYIIYKKAATAKYAEWKHLFLVFRWDSDASWTVAQIICNLFVVCVEDDAQEIIVLVYIEAGAHIYIGLHYYVVQ